MTTVFRAHIKRGRADSGCPTGVIPTEIQQAAELWENQGEEARQEILELLSRHLKANFVPCDICGLDDLIVETDDVQAFEVVVTGFYFGEQDLPSVTAYANYRLTTVGPVDNERLEEWQDEEGEYLTDGVNFFWAFEDPKAGWCHVLSEHEGAGIEVLE